MVLPNSKLESIYTELCSLLAEVGNEQMRTRSPKPSDARIDLDKMAQAIEDWKADASKFEDSEEDGPEVAHLVEHARELTAELYAIRHPRGT